MKSNGNTPHPVCAAVRELRRALGQTQQQFAVYLNLAVRTITRWESVRPPSGAALLDLADLAKQVDRHDLAEKFHKMHAADMHFDPFAPSPPHTRLNRVFSADGRQVTSGLFAVWLDDPDQLRWGTAFAEAVVFRRNKKLTEEQQLELEKLLNEFYDQTATILRWGSWESRWRDLQ